MSRLARAAEAATCDTLQQLGGGLVGMAAWALGAGQVKASIIGMTAGMASNLAYNYACAPQDLSNAPGQAPQTGCQEFAAGSGFVWMTDVTTGEQERLDYLGRMTGLRLVQTESGTVDGNSFQFGSFYVQRNRGGPYVDEGQAWETSSDFPYSWELRPDGDAVCGTPVSDGPQQPPPTQPYEYTDEESGCTLNVEFQGFIQPYEDGPVEPVYLISGTETERNSGGRIGGCNFEPTIVYGPGGGGGGGGSGNPINIPVPPDGEPPRGPDGEPWWLPALKAAIQGAAAGAVEALVEELFEEKFSAANYTLTGICEEPDAQGNQPEYSRPVAGGDFYTAAMSRIDAMQDLLQAHLGYKTPICSPFPDNSNDQGDYRTISFVSRVYSPYGRNRLRKRFKYRSQSGLGLDGVVDHWKSFSWQSGPVVVKHRGSSLGHPQVWAASINEGKRVIRHAAREAGIDPDQVGEWTVGGSDNPRYGVSATMSVENKGGYWWITARDGEDGRPQVEET